MTWKQKSRPTAIITLLVPANKFGVSRVAMLDELKRYVAEQSICVSYEDVSTLVFNYNEKPCIKVTFRNYPKFNADRNKLLQCATALGHKMALAGGSSEFIIEEEAGVVSLVRKGVTDMDRNKIVTDLIITRGLDQPTPREMKALCAILNESVTGEAYGVSSDGSTIYSNLTIVPECLIEFAYEAVRLSDDFITSPLLYYRVVRWVNEMRPEPNRILNQLMQKNGVDDPSTEQLEELGDLFTEAMDKLDSKIHVDVDTFARTISVSREIGYEKTCVVKFKGGVSLFSAIDLYPGLRDVLYSWTDNFGVPKVDYANVNDVLRNYDLNALSRRQIHRLFEETIALYRLKNVKVTKTDHAHISIDDVVAFRYDGALKVDVGIHIPHADTFYSALHNWIVNEIEIKNRQRRVEAAVNGISTVTSDQLDALYHEIHERTQFKIASDKYPVKQQVWLTKDDRTRAAVQFGYRCVVENWVYEYDDLCDVIIDWVEAGGTTMLEKLQAKDVSKEDFVVKGVKDMTMKDTNPKDAIGVKKWRQFAVVPMQVLWEVGVGMLEGALKYGRHNYRASGVRSSVYVDAAIGHIQCWFEGQDLDPDTQLSHITKAICSLVVLRDAEMNKFLVDDRPPSVDVESHSERLQKIVEDMFAKHADKKPHHYTQKEDPATYLK